MTIRNQPTRVRGAALGALALCLTTLVTGCSMNDSGGADDLGYTPTTLGVEDARKRTKQVSSQIFDMIGLPGAASTPVGPGASTCPEDREHLFKIRHPWSVYDVSEEELKQGFERLRQALPAKGWKVVSYGPNNSKAKSLELLAESEKEHFAVKAELWVGSTDPKKKNLIGVSVVSGCFRAPEGTDLKGLY
ncbi:hypothetical protein [Streptomyces narbonensis]|uniref:hypothetical protein n=1 Tax=Streptomyces narbonensis TaxID=67333 RepID=UPI001676E6C7|nr:hypothetical protein [Streptomyces narbonensis]GGW01849.1 hypothetical protein GCM10010230_33440 [Streptomyces narbonensis]